MTFPKKSRLIRWFIILTSVILIGIFLWNITLFFNQLKKEERKKMETWVEAQTDLIETDAPDPILLSIIQKNTSTPMILYSIKDSLYEARNIPDEDELTQREMQSLARTYQQQYEPIKIKYQDELYQIVYYGNSSFITKTKYFPLIIILAILLFLGVLYYFYMISKANEQNKLWAGMAKETAHQIGTPLSSLVGWAELLKLENVDPTYISEMEKDISRLKVITERFSKIGSVPVLQKKDLVYTTKVNFDYLKNRGSKLIDFTFDQPDHPITVDLNPQLFGWTIENLVKNATDAVRGKGKIRIEITEDRKWAYLYVSDTGKGIAKKNFNRIFKPGETSKKRGWGLGLSLARRIIQEYHRGRIKVLKSTLGKGTTFEIKLKKVSH